MRCNSLNEFSSFIFIHGIENSTVYVDESNRRFWDTFTYLFINSIIAGNRNSWRHIDSHIIFLLFLFCPRSFALALLVSSLLTLSFFAIFAFSFFLPFFLSIFLFSSWNQNNTNAQTHSHAKKIRRRMETQSRKNELNRNGYKQSTKKQH